jgi:UDP-N-acetylglucosamine acyltransferase
MENTKQSPQPLNLSAHPSASIHPTAVIAGDVAIAADVRIDPFCVLTGPLRIESGCRVGTGSVIGGAPEHRLRNSAGTIVIGAGTIIHEYCVVHHGTSEQGTRIGSNCYIMNRAYIAHDCQIADDVTISSGVALGGHVSIHRAANLGMQVTVHQYSTIGAHTMIGMSTPVSKDVPPLCLVAGNPIHLLRVNQQALARLQLDEQSVWAESSGLVFVRDNTAIDAMIAKFVQESRRPMLFEICYSASGPPRKPR